MSAEDEIDLSPPMDDQQEPDDPSAGRDGGADALDGPEPTDGARNALEWAVVLVAAVLVALVLRAVALQAFWIPSESMETTLLVDDKVLVDKVSYRLHEIHRGDIVVFARPPGVSGEYPDLVKRVIGLPGETLTIADGVVSIDGEALDESYLDADVEMDDFGPVEVPEGQLFVMGDNREHSGDSRVFGPIDDDLVVGRVFVRYWPLNRLGSP